MWTCFSKTLQRMAIGLATACLIILPAHVHALGFGSIVVKSALNEPLNAEIDLLSATAADLKGLKVNLASREAFARAGIDRPTHLETIRFSVQRRASGQAYLKLTTTQSVREPFLDFLLEMSWKSGRMLREYTVLLDPPGLTPAQPGVLASPKTVEPEPEPLASESIAAIPEELLEPSKTEPEQQAAVAAAVQAEPVAEEAVAPEDVFTDEKFPLIPLTEYQGDERMDYHLDEGEAPAETKLPAEAGADESWDYGVKKNDKLWLIAKQLKPKDGSVSLFQVMVALLRSNPDAFVKNNVHRLKAGYVLRLEDRALLSAMSREQALAEYTVQTRAWEQYKQERAAKIAARRAQVKKASDVGMAGEAPAQAESPAAKGGELVLAAPEGETQSSGSGTKAPEVNNEVVILREEIKQALAEAESNKDTAFNARLRELEGELKDLQRSLTVKDDELAVLQKQLSDINKQAEEAKSQQAEAEAEAEKQEAAVPVEEVQAPAPEVEEQAKVEEEIIDRAEEAEQAPQEASFFKDNLTLIILAIGGGLAAVLAGVFFLRRRQERSALEQSLLSDVPPEEAVASDELSLETNLSGESSFLSDFVVSGGSSDTDVDPLTEADVFMAYGRYEAAEERIQDAINKDPERLELHTKLLEIHNTTKNTEAFEAEAEKFFDKIERDPSHSLWQKVVIMGSMLVPQNPLFAAAAGETAEQAELTQEETAETAEPEVEAEAAQDEMVETAEVEAESVAEAPEEEVATAEQEEETGYFNSEAEQAAAEETPEQAAESTEQVAADEMSVDEELDSIMSNLNLEEKDLSQEDEILNLEPDFVADLDQEVPIDVSDLDVDSDLSLADLDVGDTEAELDATDVAGLDTPPVVDEVGTKLDLAKAYIDMGDPDGARSILDEVLEEGTPPQQQEAQQLMQQI